MAEGLSKLFALDEVLFIPAHVAPHKREAAVSPALHRYAMLALATQPREDFRVSTVELDKPERPYTWETLSHMRGALGSGAAVFFVMGADSWADITTWREWERVLSLSNHIVVTRPGYELGTAHVTPAVRERVVDLRGGAGGIDDGGEKIYVTDAVQLDISATEVRRAVREGREGDWEKLVPPPVADYIRKYGLYEEA